MPRSPRFPAPDRPDPEVRLLAAVAERDVAQARRLADQLVHRRGVAAVQSLLTGRLSEQQGESAGQWLADLVGLTMPAHLAAISPAAAVPESRAADAGWDTTWIEDLVREEQTLAALSARTRDALAPLPESAPEPPSSAPQPLIPRLMAVSQGPQPVRAPAPAPASLARLRSWLHDDGQLAEAS